MTTSNSASAARVTSRRAFSRNAIDAIFRARLCCPWLRIPPLCQIFAINGEGNRHGNLSGHGDL